MAPALNAAPAHPRPAPAPPSCRPPKAAEVGLTAAALARHLLNAAALRTAVAGAAPEPLLLPAAPPPVEPLQAFAFSHLTGANRPLQDVQGDLEEYEVRQRGGGASLAGGLGGVARGAVRGQSSAGRWRAAVGRAPAGSCRACGWASKAVRPAPAAPPKASILRRCPPPRSRNGRTLRTTQAPAAGASRPRCLVPRRPPFTPAPPALPLPPSPPYPQTTGLLPADIHDPAPMTRAEPGFDCMPVPMVGRGPRPAKGPAPRPAPFCLPPQRAPGAPPPSRLPSLRAALPPRPRARPRTRNASTTHPHTHAPTHPRTRAPRTWTGR
jgi:hypothetical protein